MIPDIIVNQENQIQARRFSDPELTDAVSSSVVCPGLGLFDFLGTFGSSSRAARAPHSISGLLHVSEEVLSFVPHLKVGNLEGRVIRCNVPSRIVDTIAVIRPSSDAIGDWIIPSFIQGGEN